MAIISKIQRILEAGKQRIQNIPHPRINIPTPRQGIANIRAATPVFRAAGRELSRQIFHPTGSERVFANIAAALPVGSAASAPGRVARIGQAFKSAAKTGYARLFAPVSLRGVGKALGSAGVAVGTIGLGRYAFSGNWRDILPTSRTAAFIGGFRFNPFATIIGFGEQATRTAVEKAGDAARGIELPTIPNIPSPEFGFSDAYKDFISKVPEVQSPFSGVNPNLGIGGASFAPSVSVGGGGGMDPSLLLLLLGGGLAGGYLLGRRKRRKKKKRVKKRKR